MPLVALVCASLLGWVEGGSPATDIYAEYLQIQATTGRTATDQVRLALWSEAHGLTAERMRHLALAILADPQHAAARGLAGLVARDGQWLQPDSVVAPDDTARAVLAEYNQVRSTTPYTVAGQWELGQWAERHGLKEQSRAHYTAVTRLNPHHERAWHRLGYKMQGGHWQTDAQIQARHAEAEAQKQANLHWLPILSRAKAMLARPAEVAEARAILASVTDPRAFPAIHSAFGRGGVETQATAVQLLGQIDSGAATQGLADLAVHSHSADIRQTALDRLSQRDPRDCVKPLVQQLRHPWWYQVRPINGPGSVGGIFVEGARFNLKRLYAPPRGPGMPTFNYLASHPKEGSQTMANAEIAAGNVQAAVQSLNDDIRAVEFANTQIHATNARVLTVLTTITGQPLGANITAWTQWVTEQQGFLYTSSLSTQAPKPTYTEIPDLCYQPLIVFPRTHLNVLPRTHSCFAAGTLVRTADGTQAIETIQAGDLVLTQNTATGTLSWQPVLATFHNPPASPYRVRMGGEDIVATGIHRFWRAGIGWTMARDLKPGDLVRILGGVNAVEAVTTEPAQPVFNLEVAEGRSFFVGRCGALVHDNSLVEATPVRFDALPGLPASTPLTPPRTVSP